MAIALQESSHVSFKHITRSMGSWKNTHNKNKKKSSNPKLLEDALRRFNQNPHPNLIAWTSLISAFAKQAQTHQALGLFQQMMQKGIEPDNVSFICILNAFASPSALPQAKLMHARIHASKFARDVAVGNAVLKMYSKCGSLEDVQSAFDRMAVRDVVSWTSLASTYAHHCMLDVTLGLLDRMRDDGKTPNAVTYVSIFNSVESPCGLGQIKMLYSHFVGSELGFDVSVVNALMNLYARCGFLEELRELFDEMGKRNVVSWNILIAAHAQHGDSRLALEFFALMEQEEWIKPNKVTFVSILNACASAEALPIGREIHARIIQAGFESDVIVATSLVKMYAKCQNLVDAREVFDKIPDRDVVAWSAMIAAYTQLGKGHAALELFREMQKQHVKPNEVTFVTLLDACASFNGLAEGKRIHSCLLNYGYERNMFVMNALMNMYSKCGQLDDACKAFKGMSKRNLVSWNVMITAYVQLGRTELALQMFEQMQRQGFKPDKYTYASIFDACGNPTFLPFGKAIHSRMASSKHDLEPEVSNALLNMYGKCGKLKDALTIFIPLFERDLVAWTSMVSAFSQHGNGQLALQFCAQMQEAGVAFNEVTLSSLLSGCSHSGLVEEGCHYFYSFSERFHQLLTPRCYGGMVDLLGRARLLDEAESLVYSMPFKANTIIWTTLLASCKASGDTERGKRIAKRILEIDPQNSAAYVVLSDILATSGQQQMACC